MRVAATDTEPTTPGRTVSVPGRMPRMPVPSGWAPTVAVRVGLRAGPFYHDGHRFARMGADGLLHRGPVAGGNARDGNQPVTHLHAGGRRRTPRRDLGHRVSGFHVALQCDDKRRTKAMITFIVTPDMMKTMRCHTGCA